MAPAPSTTAIIRAPKRTDMARWCARSGSRIASVARSHRYVCSCARALCGVQWRERGSLRLLTEAHAVTSCGGHLTTRGRQTGHLYCQRAANTRPDNRTYAEKTTKTTSFVSRERAWRSLRGGRPRAFSRSTSPCAKLCVVDRMSRPTRSGHPLQRVAFEPAPSE